MSIRLDFSEQMTPVELLMQEISVASDTLRRANKARREVNFINILKFK